MKRNWISGGTAAEIAASVEEGLHAGKATAGDVLPTVRELAIGLGISPATVGAAYKLLRARGLLTGEGRQGTRIAARVRVPSSVAALDLPPGAIDLASGGPDPMLLPPLEPALRAIATNPQPYTAEPSLRALVAFAAREFEADGISPRSISVLSGALDAVERTLREHVRPGDAVAVEDPVFPGIVDLMKASGLRPIPFGVDDEGPVPDELEKALRGACRALVVTPRAQNPTGAAISPSRATELRRILRRFPDVLLIENDYAAPISGAPPVTLIESRQRWAVVRSTAKFLGPDLRVALMAADELTSARVQGRQALGMRWVSHILQQLALALWSDPSSGRRLARAADIYGQRRRALVDALASRDIPGSGRSGLSVWIPVREEGRVVGGCLDRGWAVAPGERFRIRAAPGIRVTISTLTPPDAERFADDLVDVLRPSGSAFA